MTTHLKYGGSTAKRTIGCPDWHNQSKDIPDAGSSAAAELGTALHAIIEDCTLDVEVDPQSYAGKTVEGVLITADHIHDKIYPALDAFDELMDTYDVEEYWCEVFAQKDDETGGTADFLGFSADGKTVVMADYKSGDGLMVYAEGNDQGLFYTMTLRHTNLRERIDAAEKIVIAIVQPSERREHTLDVWETDHLELNLFIEEHEQAVALSKTRTPPQTGDHCKFCPAEFCCPAKTELVAIPDAYPLSVDLLDHAAAVYERMDELKSYMRSAEKILHDAAEKGATLKGLKLVARRANRSYKDDAKVLAIVKSNRKIKNAEASETKLKSPAQLEKMCKASGLNFSDIFGEQVVQISSGNTLVRESDPRPAVMQSATQLADRAQRLGFNQTQTQT